MFIKVYLKIMPRMTFAPFFFLRSKTGSARYPSGFENGWSKVWNLNYDQAIYHDETWAEFSDLTVCASVHE